MLISFLYLTLSVSIDSLIIIDVTLFHRDAVSSVFIPNLNLNLLMLHANLSNQHISQN